MEESKQTPEENVPEDKPIIEESRVDEFAIGQFGAMGYETVLPDTVVKVYKAMKRQKDRMSPGRLSPEGFAFVALLADILDGNFKSGE